MQVCSQRTSDESPYIGQGDKDLSGRPRIAGTLRWCPPPAKVTPSRRLGSTPPSRGGQSKMRHGLPAAIWLGALLVPLISDIPAHAESGIQCIWFNEGDPATSAPQGNRYFRRSFSVGRWADEATLDVTADNAFTVWL